MVACGWVALAWLQQKEESPKECFQAGLAAYEAEDLPTLQANLHHLEDAGREFRSECLLLRAMSLVLQDKAEVALDLLHESARSEATKGRALSLAGELLYRRQDFRNAEGVLKAAIAADPSLADPHRWLVAWYYDIGAMDDALRHLEVITKLEPQDARPWRMRGLILADFERHAEAIDAYTRTLDIGLQPHVEQEVHLELAASLLAARQPDQALQHIELCAETTRALSLRAECYLSQGKTDEAHEALTASLALEPTSPKALMLKATAQRENGQIEQAAKTLELAIATHPHDFDFRFQLMGVYTAIGEKEKAAVQRAEMQRLRALRTKFTELHHQSMQDPNSSRLRYELGKTAQELGKSQLAISWYQAALALDPNNAAALQALDEIHERAPK